MQIKLVSMRVILVLVIFLSSLSAVAGRGSDAKKECWSRILEAMATCQTFSFNGDGPLDAETFSRRVLQVSENRFNEEFQVSATRCGWGESKYYRVDFTFLPYNYRNRRICIEWKYERDEQFRNWVIETPFEDEELAVPATFPERVFEERETPEEFKPTGRSYDTLSRIRRGLAPVFNFGTGAVSK